MVPLEKRQLSQKMVQSCENHQIHRADFGKKSTEFQCTLCANMYKWEVHEGGHLPRGRVVWLLCGHNCTNLWLWIKSQRSGTAAPYLCTLCEHGVFATLVNPIKLGGLARLRKRCPWVGVDLRNQRQLTRWSWSWPNIVVGLVAADEIVEHR